MDLSAIQRRAGELAAQRDKLDTNDTATLARIAEQTYLEVEKVIGEETQAPWYTSIVPVAYMGIGTAQDIRYKKSLDKLKYAKGWLDNAKKAQSDSVRRLGYKQAFSDSAHALQLFAEEASKGSTPSRIVDRAKEEIDDQIGKIKTQALVGVVIAGFFLWALGQSKK